MTRFKYIFLIVGMLIAIPVSAYIGPGAGISFLGSLFSTLFVVLLTILSILFWPLRYMWKRLRRLSREAKQNTDNHQDVEKNKAVIMQDNHLLDPKQKQSKNKT